MEEIVTQRVNQLMEALGYNENSLSKEIKVNQSTLNYQLRKGGSGISITNLLVILDHFPNISAEWVMRGKGDMFIDKDPEKTIKLNRTNEELLAHIRWLEELVDDLRGKQRKEKTA